MSETDRDQHGKAIGLLSQMQRTLIRRLTEYVIENESSLRLAADGSEGYGYTVHQLDELFLNRLNLIERTIAELQKFPSGGASRYRTQCFLASRGDVEKEINSRLEKLTDARILGVSVSPAAAEPAAPDVPDPPARPKQLRRGEGQPSSAAGPGPEAPDSGERGSPGDQMLVTVFYYGPAPRAT